VHTCVHRYVINNTDNISNVKHKKNSFIDKTPTLDTYWRSIILLGKNVASYKFALAKTLLEVKKENTRIYLEDIALSYAKNICAHLINKDKQITSSSSKFLDACRKFNKKELTEDELSALTVKLGFNNVIDAFHNISHSEVPRFFEDDRRKDSSIVLTDNFYNLNEIDNFKNLPSEVESRWNLWETAISLDVNPNLLEILNDDDSNQLFIFNEDRRQQVTSSKGALNGYQKGKCFYCSKSISIESANDHSCEVDHFFPHTLKNKGHKNVDQIWNLVLSCKDCNRGVGGKFERIPDISYLYSLNDRNNFFVESHHPLRDTIMNQTGISHDKRHNFLQKFFDSAVSIIPGINKWMPRDKFGEKL